MGIRLETLLVAKLVMVGALQFNLQELLGKGDGRPRYWFANWATPPE